MEIKEKKELEVTVDKRHIVSLGERLYTEGVELLRELVNNAYDADATVVHITLTPDKIVVEDNGSGLDLEGLKQCFNIGSEEKVLHPLFRRESGKSAAFTMYVARLMTQEISLMNETRSPRLAFDHQSKLLKDAFSE